MEKLVCFFLNIGDVLDLKFQSGEFKRYQVIETEIVPIDSWQSGFHANGERITLVTKFPFDSHNSGERMLYVVTARRVPNTLGFTRPPINTVYQSSESN